MACYLGVGTKLRFLRMDRGMSLEELADRLDIPPDCLGDIEEEKRRLSQETLQEVAAILGVPETYFLPDDLETDQISWRAGQRLKALRERKKVSLAEIARRTEISVAHLSEIERAQTGGSLKVWEKIAAALGVSVSYFFREPVQETLGQKMKKLRTSRGLTQKELAQKVGLSYSLVAQIESSRVQPAIGTLTCLARELGVSPCYFLTDESQEDDIVLAVASQPEVRRLVEKLLRLWPAELEAVEDLVDHLLVIRNRMLRSKGRIIDSGA